jgi:DNA-binding NtrC family response regulator
MSLIGNSPVFRKVIRLIEKMAGCDAPVLIEGETGTGKEVAARALHYQGKRHGKPFIPVNCGAIPDALFENELFGHSKGAFTDAKENQPGFVALADSGTLFLDEIEALSPKGQVTLLRFMQDQQYRPLGGGRELNANVRMITASNADLAWLTEHGEFRKDLFFRLKILHLELPPLR